MSHSLLSTVLAGSRIQGLDALRAFSILAVLIDHTEYKFGGPLSLVTGGIWLEIFFVLSGFLITFMLLDEFDRFGSISFKDFFQRRMARLLPLFYVYVLIGIVYLTLVHKPVPWGAVLSGVFYVVNYFQAFNGAPTHFLSHCWSLALEEQFYFFWPLILAFLLRVRWHLDWSLIGLIVAIWLYRAMSQLLGWHTDAYIYRALDTRADHLLLGCLLAVLLRQPKWCAWIEKLWRMPFLMAMLFVALITSGLFHANLTYKYVFAYALEPVVIALLVPMVILSAASEVGILSKILNARWVVLTGQASYGIYIFHQLFMAPVRNMVEKMTGSYDLGILISMVVLIVFAHQVFIQFEAPMRQKLRPKQRLA